MSIKYFSTKITLKQSSFVSAIRNFHRQRIIVFGYQKIATRAFYHYIIQLF